MTFEVRVKKFMGGKKFEKLPSGNKKVIRKLSTFQSKTSNIYKNGFLKVYEELGIVQMNYYFVFDASAAVHYYIKKDEFHETLAFLMALRQNRQAFFFLPSICVVEVFNTFAKHHYRYKILSKVLYDQIREDFINAIHDRAIFYCYDLNRYHNLNTETILPIEHTTDTEFHAINRFPAGATQLEIEESLEQITQDLKKQHYNFSQHYLSGYDVLVTKALELRRFFGEKKVFIVTKDKRLAKIAKTGKFANVINLNEIGNDMAKLKVVLRIQHPRSICPFFYFLFFDFRLFSSNSLPDRRLMLYAESACEGVGPAFLFFKD